MTTATTRPWYCPQTDCPAGSHDHYAAHRGGCRSDAAREDARVYRKRLRQGTATPKLVSGLGVARRIEACHAMGHNGAVIGRELGVSANAVNKLRRLDQPQVTTRTHKRYVPILERLAMVPGSDVRTRNWAQRRGFRPLLAWDDIDDPAETPCDEELVAEVDTVDEAVLDGVLYRGLDFAERTAAEQEFIVETLWRRRAAEGDIRPVVEVAALLGLEQRTVERVHRRTHTRAWRANRKEKS